MNAKLDCSFLKKVIVNLFMNYDTSGVLQHASFVTKAIILKIFSTRLLSRD